MATLKLKAKSRATGTNLRPPLRGAGSAPRHRPTLAEAEVERRERRARDAARPPDARPGRAQAEATRSPAGRGPAPGGAGPKPAQRRDVQRSAAPPKRDVQPSAPPLTLDVQRSAARPKRDVQRSAAPPGREEEPRLSRAAAPESVADPSLRLSKRMSQLGLASRREADDWIAKGYVRVDGRIVSELGSRVLPDQQVTIDARARQLQAQKVTILINKPVGFVSGQAEDGYQPAVTLIQPENQWREDRSGISWTREYLRGLAPAGRLDIDSVGMLVLTQDGRVARQLIGDDSSVEKEYLVRVRPAPGREPLAESGLALLRHGLELDGEPLREAQVEWINDDQLRFVLRQGKKRQIRRMCEAVGLEVLGLKRVRIGAVVLGDLPVGRWRFLGLGETFA